MENDARVDRGRTQMDFDARAGVQADAGSLDRVFERALLDHGCRGTRRVARRCRDSFVASRI
jgi:hypothetical protein